MRYKDLISEGETNFVMSNIDMRNFYANMDLLLKSKGDEMPSSLEGIDAVARLGFLGNSKETISKKIEVDFPQFGGNYYGYYSSAKDQVTIPFERIFQRGSLKVTATITHEFRHRAFYYISKTPAILDLLPKELKPGGKWADGYGTFIDREKYTIKPKKVELLASPEHAMIYAVQFQNIETHYKKDFIKNSVLGDLGADYWRDLYRQVNDACKQFLTNNFEGKYKDDMYPKLAQGQTPLIKNQSTIAPMSMAMMKYYQAWQSIEPYAQRWITRVKKDLDSAIPYLHVMSLKMLLTPSVQGHVKIIKTLGDIMTAKSIEDSEQNQKIVMDGLNIHKIWSEATLNDLEQIDPKHPMMKEILQVREYWDLLDIRNYTSKQVQTIVNTPKTPTQARPMQITFVEFAKKTAYIQGKRETAMQHVISMIGKPLFESVIEHVVFMASTAKTRGWDHNYTMDKTSKSQLELAVNVSNNYKPKDGDPKDLVMNFLRRAMFTQKP